MLNDISMVFRMLLQILICVRLKLCVDDYFVGDLVQTGIAPNLDHFICLTDHTSDGTADPGTSPESTNWTRLIAGTYTASQLDRQFAFFFGFS